MARITTGLRSNENKAQRAPDALGQSENFLDFQARLAAVAPVNRPVLIIGERGTGKELAAARLHFLSRRWEQPLVSLNCAALSPSLIESELFGHEPGAFTGAAGRRAGRFEMANMGTLFLDELGLMPMSAQEKVLRVTEYGVFERVGGSQELQVDVRIIGATNADLGKMAEQGRFKADLLDRLSFEVLHIPPLRARQSDIPLLAMHFTSRMANEMGMNTPPEISKHAFEKLEQHSWPGNVRELKNIIERAVYQCDGQTIRDIDFSPLQSPWSSTTGHTSSIQTPPAKHDLGPILQEHGLEEARMELERRALQEALETSETQNDAAEKLKLSYNQFRALYRKHRG
jgi:psp operon transcriptional activator